MFKIFDSKTKKFKILNNDKEINIYLCGPTVYDDLHIGNFRNIILFDCLTRILKELKYNFNFVQNLTDIDDKIIEKSIKEQKTEKEITKKFINNYLDLLFKFKIKIDNLKKVTDFIDSIKKMIQKLLDLNLAYKTKDGIYFDVKKDKNYGRLKKNNVSSNLEISDIFYKKNIEDFVIWKFKTKGKVWDSNWGKGRPGWHIECAVIINDFFKNNLVIHGGGKDLLFPHHENEFAILKSINNKFDDTIWMHNGFVHIKHEKISKSKLNFKKMLVKKLLKKYSQNTIRFFFYFSNYKNDIEFNWEQLDFCKELEKKIKIVFKRVRFKKFIENIIDNIKINNKILKEFLNEISNDLNTVKGLDLIFKQLKNINFLLDNNKLDNIIENINTLKKCLVLLGIEIKLNEFTTKDKEQINLWKNFILNKNFEESDKIRKILKEKNIF